MRLIYFINDGEWRQCNFDEFHNFTGKKKVMPSTYFVNMTYGILLQLRGD